MSKKGGTGNQYDPQIGAAATQTANTAAEAQQFAENYQTNTIAPVLNQMVAASQQSQAENQSLYGLNMQEATQAQSDYNQYGVPAEQNYYNMVDSYSQPAEQEREAESALGDMKTAEGVQQANITRSLGARGIDPSSPAAVAALQSTATTNAAAEAAAMNQARNTARTMGMQLTSDAANFGRGGASAVLGFGGAAGGNANSSFGAASGALGGASSASSTQLAGYNTALNGYESNMGNYSRLGSTDMQLSAQADAGFGQLLGQAGTLAMTAMSDRRLKKNIVRVGTLPSGIGIYEFEYRWPSPRYRGVMADEVEQIIPEAVAANAAGFKSVNYAMVR